MNIIEQKTQIAVVVVGYNRVDSIKRLIENLRRAEYDQEEVPLIISLDKSENYYLLEYVESVSWPYGKKYVIKQEEKLGLKNHILKCGELTKYYKAIILLEDDLYVSSEFYRYVKNTLNKYENEESISGISLYKNEWNGYANCPLNIINNGCDVFVIQAVSTWGQCWNERMWREFKTWYDININIEKELDYPKQIKEWHNAWSKDYILFMLEENKYFIFPQLSVSTNFSEPGVHGKEINTAYQVELLNGPKTYNLLPLNQLVKYDIYGNNKELYKYIGIDENAICIDLYGNNNNVMKRKYLLSSRILPYKIVRQYGLYLRPMELNVIHNINGSDIFLYDTDNIIKTKKRTKNEKILLYHIKDYTIKTLIKVLFYKILRRLRLSNVII